MMCLPKAIYSTMKHFTSLCTRRATTPSDATVLWIHMDISTTILSIPHYRWGICWSSAMMLQAGINLLTDVVTDDEWLHRGGDDIWSFSQSNIFRRRTGSCGDQHLAYKCHRPVVTRYVRLTMADGFTQTGVRWGNVLSFIRASLASSVPPRSYYTSALTSNSLYFCRGENRSAYGLYYYQSIGFMTTTSGYYDIRSNSTLDTTEYIFNSIVHRMTNVSGSLISDDGSSRNNQLLMTISLRAMFNYILFQHNEIILSLCSWWFTANFLCIMSLPWEDWNRWIFAHYLHLLLTDMMFVVTASSASVFSV